MSDYLKKSDFPDIIADKFVSEEETRHMIGNRIENRIVDNFQKGKITEEIFLGGINTLDKIEKGKRGVVGEIRTWSGKKYQKTATGWAPVKESDAPAGKTDSEQKTGDTKVSDFGIAGKVGGGYRATGTINGKKIGVDIPSEMIRGVANFDDKELRQKIKNHLAEKGEEITTRKTEENKGEGWNTDSNQMEKKFGSYSETPITRGEINIKADKSISIHIQYNDDLIKEGLSKFKKEISEVSKGNYKNAEEAKQAIDTLAKKWNSPSNPVDSEKKDGDPTRAQKSDFVAAANKMSDYNKSNYYAFVGEALKDKSLESKISKEVGVTNKEDLFVEITQSGSEKAKRVNKLLVDTFHEVNK